MPRLTQHINLIFTIGKDMTILIILGVVILLFVLYRMKPKEIPVKHVVYTPVFSQQPRINRQDQRIRWRMGMMAPPLPLSAMSSIRIGRQVNRSGGPGDPIWDYDHLTSA